jgi:adenine-specific DNA-methyltransferase
MNKQDLISKIKQLDGISQDERSYLINLVNTKKKYGLVWEDKPEDVEEQLRENLPVLKEVKDKAIINGEGNPNHILIEGDNLHALTALTFTHEGKVDVIYIDPPYNTGKKDFKYNDSFVDKEDTYRHSKWLSFMEKRLRIGKKLLNEKGIIFISIDDNEQSQIKLLCDEIFNSVNFICQFIHKNNSNKNQAKLVGVSTEYVLCYAKSKSELKEISWKIEKKGANDINKIFKKLKNQGLSIDEISEEIKILYQRPKYAHLSRWNKTNDKGVFKDADLSREGGAKNYTIINPFTNKECVIPNRGWGKSYEELIRLQKEDLIWYGGDDTPPGMIDYITDENYSVPDSFLYFDNSVDTKWQKTLFGKIVFENPKPLDMIIHFIKMVHSNNQTILDFFAGSGTTLHATMALNAEDGGKRKCILLTNNENNICEEVTYKRNKSVIEGFKNKKGDVIKGLKNNNLRYFKSEYVSREQSHKNKKELTRLATELLCIKEDCYQEISLKEKWYSSFANSNSQFIVIYDDLMIDNSIEIIKKINTNKKNTNPIKVYVFSNGQYPYTEDFEEVLPYITLCALPDAIYKAYQNVLPKKKKEIIPILEDDILGEEENLFNQENE